MSFLAWQNLVLLTGSFRLVFWVNLLCFKWTDCITDKIFKNIEIVKSITTALKSILNLVKLQSLVRNIVKCKNYRPAKFANFVYFCITHGKLIPLSRKRYQFSPRNTKVYKICKFYRVIFFTFYNISQPNFAILLNLGCSLMLW